MPESAYLSVRQAADYLAVSEDSVRRYIAHRALPAFRLRGVHTVRIRRADLDAFVVPIGSRTPA